MTRRLVVAAHVQCFFLYYQDKHIVDGFFIELYIHNPLQNY